MTEAYINRYLLWRQHKIFKNGQLSFEQDRVINHEVFLLATYRYLALSYPKFFKMDMLSKLGFLAATFLNLEKKIDTTLNAGIICSTHHGCLEVDKAFEKSRKSFASPTLFVYTLPNIALGEICIAQKIKGPQICLIEEQTNSPLLYHILINIFKKNRAKSCIIGHIDATQQELYADMAWVSLQTEGSNDILLSPESLASIWAKK